MEFIDGNNGFNVLNELPFDEQTLEILKTVKTNSNSVVFSGLFLLELYYNKTNNLKLNLQPIKRNPIDLFVFGTPKTIINSVYTIIEQIQNVKQTGPMRIYEYKNDSVQTIYSPHKFIQIQLTGFVRPVNIYCVSCKNSTGLMDMFESSNEMMFWAHDTGLVISLWAKMGMETNQVVPSYKNNISISSQKLFELKSIGFDISNYVKSTGFTKPLFPVLKHSRTDGDIFFDDNLDEVKIKSYMIELNNKTSQWTDLDNGDIKLSLSKNIIDNYLIHPQNKTMDHCGLILYGKFNQVFSVDVKIGNGKINKQVYIVLTIEDDEIASKLKNITKFYVDTIRQTHQGNIETYIVNTNYLNSNEKYLSYQPNGITEKLNNYMDSPNMVIVCKLHPSTYIVNTVSNRFLTNYDQPDKIQELISPNSIVYIWYKLTISCNDTGNENLSSVLFIAI